MDQLSTTCRVRYGEGDSSAERDVVRMTRIMRVTAVRMTTVVARVSVVVSVKQIE